MEVERTFIIGRMRRAAVRHRVFPVIGGSILVTLKMLKDEPGCHWSAFWSNISFVYVRGPMPSIKRYRNIPSCWAFVRLALRHTRVSYERHYHSSKVF